MTQFAFDSGYLDLNDRLVSGGFLVYREEIVSPQPTNFGRFALVLGLAFAFTNTAFAQAIDTHMHLDGIVVKEKPDESMMPKTGRPVPPAKRRRMMMRKRMMQQKRGGVELSELLLEQSARKLLKQMRKNGVGRAFVMPPPQGLNQPGGYDFNALIKVVAKFSDRLSLVAGGGTINPMIHDTPADAVTKEIEKKFKREVIKLVQAGAVAFGEMTAMHLCLNPRAPLHCHSSGPSAFFDTRRSVSQVSKTN